MPTALDRPARRRLLRVLVAAQVLSGLGQSGAAAGALLAMDLTGSEALASLPLALLVVGASATVVPISRLSRRAGRRAGLGTALGLAVAGAAGVVAGGALGSFALVCAASVPFGAGNTAVMLARYAAADLATAAQRGRAIGAVLFATTFGAVAGPNLLAPTGHVAAAVGLPELTGPYALSAAAFALAGALLLARLRPDPLTIALRAADAPAAADRPPLRRMLTPAATASGLVTIVVANFVMVAVMAMAPVHMQAMGHDLEIVGLAVSVHVAGMFAPAPLAGWLTDRLGPLPVAGAGALLLVAAGLLSSAAGDGAPAFTVGLLLLGVGWDFGLVAGSALLTAAVPAGQRPRVEGAGEVGMGIAAGTATAVAGPVVGLAGYAALALAGGVAAAALGPFLIAVARRGVPTRSAPAPRALG